MEKKGRDITNDAVEWFKNDVLPKLSDEQVKELIEHPEIITESFFKAFKKACEERGVDYTKTLIYQEELKFRAKYLKGSAE